MAETTTRRKVKRQRDLNEMIDVKCIVQGGLNFVTSTGLSVVWDAYGDIYPLEYKELIYMINKYKRFFEEPWVIVDQDVLEDLKATHYYKDIIDYENIDSIFSKTPEEVKEVLSKVPEGTKRLIADRASQALRKGQLDSVKVIDVLQKELNIELM
jgi:DNA primase large subunit